MFESPHSPVFGHGRGQATLRYRDVLGPDGTRRYRQLASERWAAVPPLGPGEEDPDRFGARFRITRIMEGLAESDGDLDALVEVMARDLSFPYHYLRIAEVLLEAGDEARAVEWAERGISESARPDGRLEQFLADAYQRLGRGDEAVALAWEDFARTPRLAEYRTLRRHAGQIGVWPDWRERAVEVLRGQRDRSELVRVLLDEDDPDAAWEEACAGGCHEGLRLQLARVRAETNPADAIPIYERAVARAIQRKNKNGYREAVDIVGDIEALMRRAGGPFDFGTYLRGMRAEHGRKRNLMALLDARWGA